MPSSARSAHARFARPLGRAALATALATTAAIAGCARGGGDEARIDGGRPGGGDGGGLVRTDAGTTPGVDGGTGGVDSGGGGVDSGPIACTSASECDDGLACNGTERCELGRCVAGAAPTCDDGVACTMDGCVEPGTCSYAPSDALCPSGQTCSATGCTTGGGSCTESPCRLVGPQCGCAAGQACYLSGATRVCAAAGSGAEGSACTGSATCMPGLDCIDFSTVAGRSARQCSRYCSTDAQCTGTGSICIHTLGDGMGGTIPGVRLCSRACNPIRQTGCAPGLMCNIYQESAAPMRFLTDCTGPVGTGSRGSFCAADSDCAAGNACVSNMCLHWCNVATDEGCTGFEICSSLTPRVVLGGVEYGVCL